MLRERLKAAQHGARERNDDPSNEEEYARARNCLDAASTLRAFMRQIACAAPVHTTVTPLHATFTKKKHGWPCHGTRETDICSLDGFCRGSGSLPAPGSSMYGFPFCTRASGSHVGTAE